MSSKCTVLVWESTHHSEFIPETRIIVAIENNEKFGTKYEIHSIVLNEPEPEMFQYIYPDLEHLMKLFPNDLPENIYKTIPLEPAIAFARTEARKAMSALCDDVYERTRLYSVINAEEWLQLTENSIAYSMSVIPNSTLKTIYKKTSFKELKTASEDADSIHDVLVEYRSKLRCL